jgi:hypothetical protein
VLVGQPVELRASSAKPTDWRGSRQASAALLPEWVAPIQP